MNTLEPRLVCVESVADLPVLWAVVQRLDLTALLDRHFPTPLHWKGPLTPSEVLAVWLLFILSESDHCLNHLEPWVAQHQHTISALLGKPIRPTDFHDDRLADWLNRLAADGVWAAFAPTASVRRRKKRPWNCRSRWSETRRRSRRGSGNWDGRFTAPTAWR